ncbi:hypothetical protein K491DRAFT_773165 [Lophiostoma macrostomum CBS 122681]|uniref:AA1-like domain-containing protein n=1 Tax=Lophiostoma macrostomum CBS 122681 TaxID=1314788 RepID=A0A6A6TRF6_9PLEO|nr:hypothetical protein K491DRAFT_773165 [Lophiostoma macrostomum CBS 122681]
MFSPTLSLLLTAALALAIPTPHLAARQNTTNIVLHVTDFTAFMADPTIEGTQSNLSFRITDPRPDFYGAADCVVPPTYFNLYAISALFDYCGPSGSEFSYRFFETGLQVRRSWRIDSNTTLTGSSIQQTAWTEGSNATKLPNGRVFARKSEWLFPLGKLQTGS